MWFPMNLMISGKARRFPIFGCIDRSLRKLVNRVLQWLNFVRNLKGVSTRAHVGIFISASFDIIMFMSSLWKYNPKMLFSGTYLVKPYGFYVYARSKTDDLYHAVPKREKDVHDIIINLLRNGDVFVDVGANIGYYTILASKIVGDRGKIISIEPISNTFKILKYNVFKLNALKNVKLNENAAWHEKTTIKFSLPTGYYGIASAVRNYKGEEVKVDTVTLDEILQPFDIIRLMKIDVEGSEYEVLLGASDALSRTEYVVMEISRKTKECLQLLNQNGFKCKKLKFTNCWLAMKNHKR